MRIAFIFSPYSYFANVFSGVVVQGRCWRDALQALGHDVEMLDPTRPIDWKGFDIVHLFQHGQWCGPLIQDLAGIGVPTFLSPIIDPPKPYGRIATLLSRIPFERGRLFQNQRLLFQYGAQGAQFASRSTIETLSLKACGVSDEAIHTIPISMSHDWDINDAVVLASPRNGAVLHVSHLAQPRKNVRRLIDSAIRLGFPLRLAGSIADVAFAAWLDSIQAQHPNIRYLGRVSDEHLRQEMLSASVFCLPSLFEGVGLVALDAGYCGCRLVVTKCGGTIDYLSGCADFVDPTDVSGLDAALSRALASPGPDMVARTHITENFTKLGSGRNLVAAYERCLAMQD